MATNDRNNEGKNGLNELERHLYGQKKGIPRPRPTTLPTKKYGLSENWLPETEREKGKPRLPSSFFKKFFFVGLIFFVVATGVSLFVFFSGGSVVSPANIEISVSGTSFAVGGEKLPLLIEIKNNNRSSLELADLVVTYPKGGLGTELAKIREAIGSIGAGDQVVRIIEPVLLGEEGETKELTIRLEYRLVNSNAIFIKETTHPVVLSSSPILISFEGPSGVVADQEFAFSLKVTSNATALIPNLGLKIRYPAGFVFAASTPEPVFGNNFFLLGDLATGAIKSIQIRGRIVGGESETKTFAVEIGEADGLVAGKLATTIATKLQTLSLTAPFVEARVLVDGVYAEEYRAAAQTDIRVDINWANNTTTITNNLEIKARLTGLFNEASVDVDDGFYDSAADTVVWNQNTNPDLATVLPGARGVASFTLSSLPLFREGTLATDPAITIEVAIKGLQPTLGASNEINNFERRVIKLATEVSVLTRAFHFSGPIQNSGPIPPRADLETTYTIVWTVTNSANLITRPRVVAVLPPYVRFVGSPVPSGESVAFSEGTREVSWRPNQINAGAGLTTSAKEVAFQVALRPTISQIGTSPNLIGETVFVGEDSFARTTVSVRRPPVTTNITGEENFPSGGGVVVQ